MKNTIALGSLLILVVLITVRIAYGVRYKQDIGGHLKLAADANSSELAQKQLKIALDNMEEWNLCNSMGDDCFTSVLWRTPDEDVGYWRENIQTTYEDLASMSDEDRNSNLTESNQLMKVRETLLDSGENGDKVTSPDGISVYPNNGEFGVAITFFFVVFMVSLLGSDYIR